MKIPEKNKPVATLQKKSGPFFQKESSDCFFSVDTNDTSFFATKQNPQPIKPSVANGVPSVQRQEQPEPPETKPSSPEPAAPIPLGRKPSAANCSSNPKFPDLGCYSQQLKLDIDENLFNNAHQFNRVATLFPGNDKLMLDTFLRYGLGKNLLDTTFGFAGVNKKWSSILSIGTGVALKAYDVFENGNLKLDLQLPIGKGVNLDIKFDYTANHANPGEEKGINTVIGISGRFP